LNYIYTTLSQNYVKFDGIISLNVGAGLSRKAALYGVPAPLNKHIVSIRILCHSIDIGRGRIILNYLTKYLKMKVVVHLEDGLQLNIIYEIETGFYLLRIFQPNKY